MSDYRYITVPAPIMVLDDEGMPAREATFPEFVAHRVRDPKYFGESLDGILAAVSLEAEFKASKPGDIVKLSLKEWSLLDGAVKSPTGGYLVAVVMQLVPFARAIVDAPAEKPVG